MKPNTHTPAPRSRGAEKMLLRDLADRHQADCRQHTKDVCRATLKHLDRFLGHTATLADFTADTIAAFAGYLAQRVSAASARTYLQKLHAIAEQAVQLRHLHSNPVPPAKRLLATAAPSQRTYLTTEELARLSDAHCPNRQVKLAFLFACTTGLRLSDIEALRWENIHTGAGGRIIIKRQQKTGREVRVPLGNSACAVLRHIAPTATGTVFHLPSRSSIGTVLRGWAANAALGKHLTFHVSRHTFATTLITANVGIYTVSRLLGHADVRTTQIYTHILDTTLRNGILDLDRLVMHAAPAIAP